MTGLYPSQAGMPGNLFAPSPPLSAGQMTIGKRMRAAGYQTVYHGKWHLGGDVKEHGFENGEECSHDETTRLLAARFWRDRDWLQHNDRPFFHVVSFLDPHDLYFFDPEETEAGFQRPWSNLDRPEHDYPPIPRSKRADWDEARWSAYHQFYSERVAKVDRDIGLLLDDLRCSGFFPNTWIIFASDHGDMAGEQNIPFKGSFMYEGVTRVPLVVVPPCRRIKGDFGRPVAEEAIEVGKQIAGLCSLLDIVPTILDLAEVERPEAMEGRSLLSWVRGISDGNVHETVFAEWHQPGVRMARCKDWKYVAYQDQTEELFHLKEDPDETRNRVTDPQCQEALKRMRGELQGHFKRTGDPWEDLSRHAFLFTPEGYMAPAQSSSSNRCFSR